MPERSSAEPHPLCRRFGFADPERRRQHLRLVGLGPEDEEAARRLNERVLAPRAEAIVARFQPRLAEHPAFDEVMRRGGDLVRLRTAHTEYLRELGLDYASADYFERRLRMGVVHADRGVPSGVYLAAYGLLQELVAEAMPPDLDPDERARLLRVFAKLCFLDVSLVVEAYVSSELGELTRLVMAERERARTDALTGLLNRGAVLEALEEALGQAAIERVPVSVVMVDLDGFKEVNDTWGHLVGDEVLREAVDRVRSAVRGFDIVGRFGGEEFLVVLRATPLEVARRIAERIRERIGSGPFDAGGHEITLTASAGVAEAEEGEQAGPLLARADQALYAAKRAGKNRVRVDLG